MPPMTLSTSTSSTSSSSTSTSSTSTSSTSQQLAPTSKKRKATGSPSASTSVSKFELDLDGTAYFRETANRKDLWVISFTKPEDFVVLCGFAPIFRPEAIKADGKIVANFQDQEDAKNFIEYKINEVNVPGLRHSMLNIVMSSQIDVNVANARLLTIQQNVFHVRLFIQL